MSRPFNEKAFLLLCALLFAQAQGQSGRTLHVATWPGHAEVFVESPPQPGRGPAPLTPYALPLPADSDYVRLYFFKPGYVDTALDVRLPKGSQSHLLVHLHPQSDEEMLEAQQRFLFTRSRHRLGLRLLWSSLLPLAYAGGAALGAQYYYHEANGPADHMRQSTLYDPKAYQEAQDEYEDRVDAADRCLRQARWATLAALGVAALGIVLNF